MHLDQPLSDKEFDELDHFLLSDRCPEDGMTMDTLHGYLTAHRDRPGNDHAGRMAAARLGTEESDAPKFKNPTRKRNASSA